MNMGRGYTGAMYGNYGNGYIQPMYGNQGYQPSYQQTQTPMSSYLAGRIVNKESDITPNEVPMDGSLGVFPKSDGSSIIVKTWNPNGTINTIEYTPVQDSEPEDEEQKSAPYTEIIERLDRIEETVKQFCE